MIRCFGDRAGSNTRRFCHGEIIALLFPLPPQLLPHRPPGQLPLTHSDRQSGRGHRQIWTVAEPVTEMRDNLV